MATGWALIEFREAGRFNVERDLGNHNRRIKELRDLKNSGAVGWPDGAKINAVHELKEKVFGERSPKYGAVVDVAGPDLTAVFKFFEANFSHVDGYT